MILSKTPLRASLFGGGTDYPAYFHHNNGAVLGGTIDKFIYTSLHSLPSFAEQKYRLSYRTVENARSVEDIDHPVIRESLKAFDLDMPLSISTSSDLPGGTGLGSSSAFTVGLCNLLYALKGEDATPLQLAEKAIHIERERLEENVGVQDHLHAAFGGFNIYTFNRDTIAIIPIKISRRRLEFLSDNSFLVFTGITRKASATLDGQVKNTAAGANDGYLSSMYSLVFEAKEIFESVSITDEDCMQEIALLLRDSWNFKKQLGSSVTNSAIETLVDSVLMAGVRAVKLLGAGGGGFLYCLGDKLALKACERLLGKGNVIPINFQKNGSSIVRI